MPEWAVTIVVAVITAAGGYLVARKRVLSKEKIAEAKSAIEGFSELSEGLQRQLDNEREHCRREIDWLNRRIRTLEGRQDRIEQVIGNGP